MSWLGDQFNSITGKINDFTKVLSESTSDLSEVPNQNGIQNTQELADRCREKDRRIELLLQEKESLESSIEELDQQHQEVINSLQQTKNSALAENRELREKLTAQTSEAASNSTQQNFQICEIPLSMENLQKALGATMGITSTTPDADCSEKDVNLIMLLNLLSNSCNNEKLKCKIEWLEKEKHMLENDTCEEDKDTVNNLINKINDYTNFLKAASNNPKSIFPVITEICSAFNLLVSEIVCLNRRFESVQSEVDALKQFEPNELSRGDGLSECNNSKLCEISQNVSISETCDSSIQTHMPDIIDKSIQHDISFLLDSKQSQTVTEANHDDSPEKDKLINELQSNINILKQQNSQFQVEVGNLKSAFNKSSSSIPSQTDDNVVCECESLKSVVEALELEKAEFKAEICNLSALINKDVLNTFSQTDESYINQCNSLKIELDACKKSIVDMEHKYNTSQKEHLDNLNDLKEKLRSRESIVSEKDAIIQSQKKEVLYLKDKIKSLIGDMNSLKSRKDSNQESESLQTSSILPHMFGSKEVEDYVNELTHLKTKVTNLELEKGKLLCVLNEKSQECSSLKSEVHKLTSIVASEKQALFKLQQDNCELKLSNKEVVDPELTKETVRKLSTMIRDKDFEIESLKQKNATLTTLLQDATNVPEHLQSLVEEKENLSKQINLYKSDREKFMVSYNTKDKECRKFASEVKELNTALSKQREEFDVLEQKHLSVAQLYEEKQKSLINAQNEMVSLKQKMTDLEQQQVHFKDQYSNLLEKIDSESTVQITKEELNDKDLRLERLTCSSEEKERLIEEKDRMIHDLSQQVKKLKLESEERDKILQSLEAKVKDSMDKVVEVRNESENLEECRMAAEQRLDDKSSECALLKEMNERLNMALREKEFAMQSMTEKVASLSQYISSDCSEDSTTVDVNQILADSESMFSKAQSLYRERDETLLALNQSKQENQSLRNEMQRMKSNEIHQTKELERLRQHLIEIEETYTNEALKSEEKEKRLQDELVEARRRAEITNTAVVDTNQRASVQIASLQEQLSMIAGQRDAALAQVSSLEDQVHHHSTAAGKLQLVLEQMQKSNERKLKEVENKWQALIEKEKMACKQFANKLEAKQKQLEESVQALEAASRLSEQLDAKEEIIANLRRELSKTENKIKSTAQEIDSIRSNTEGKVDRVVMKSLVLGYFSTPPGQKSEVIRLLARVLDFNQEEMERAGIVVGRQQAQAQKGIFSSIFGRLPSMGSPERAGRQSEKSFTTLFVQFLENESQPIVPIPFPVDKMSHDHHLKSHAPSSGLGSTSSSPIRKSPLLLDIDSAFPSFTPVPAIEYSASPAPAILKEVLE